MSLQMGIYLFNVAKNSKLHNNFCSMLFFHSYLCFSGFIFFTTPSFSLSDANNNYFHFVIVHLFFHIHCIVYSLMDFVLVLARTGLILAVSRKSHG